MIRITIVRNKWKMYESFSLLQTPQLFLQFSLMNFACFLHCPRLDQNSQCLVEVSLHSVKWFNNCKIYTRGRDVEGTKNGNKSLKKVYSVQCSTLTWCWLEFCWAGTGSHRFGCRGRQFSCRSRFWLRLWHKIWKIESLAKQNVRE